MPRIAYVNGRYQPHIRASVHIEDRGFQFADGVYEVIAVSKGQLVDIEPHLDRLDRSLGELDIKWPVHRRAFRIILAEVIRRNRVVNGSVYLQVTRGVAPRDFAYSDDLKPSLIVYARRAPKDTIESASKGHKVVSKPDIRWKRCDIKTVSLLPAVMAKQAAVGEGAIEAWLVNEEGIVTEGTSSNAGIVTPEKELVTRQTDNLILSGITRQTVATLAASAGLTFVERPFSLEDAKKAQEAFCTSSTALVKPIVEIDGTQIGNGEVGPITRQLIEHYLSYMDNPA
ncbi:MAG: D-amino-acid transaminase [Rhodospirillaceae bacterium]|nr:D-amino-acid transaminase [Rhodospirillaceae bacterium]